MKRIDNYLDNYYIGNNSREVKELKNEIKDHLLELLQEFIDNGIEKDKAIDMAIEQFDDGPDMQKEILASLKKSNVELQNNNRYSIKVTKKLLNRFRNILLLSILIYSISRGYSGFAQYKTSEYDKKINEIINQLVEDDTIYNTTILYDKVDEILSADSNVVDFWITNKKDNEYNIIYRYLNEENRNSVLNSGLEFFGVNHQLSRVSSEKDEDKITSKNEVIEYVVILSNDLYSLAKTIWTASLYLLMFSFVIYLISFIIFKRNLII